MKMETEEIKMEHSALNRQLPLEVDAIQHGFFSPYTISMARERLI